jgi:hypothetical protein
VSRSPSTVLQNFFASASQAARTAALRSSDRCQSNAGCYQGNDDGDVSYFEHHQLQSMSTAIIASVRAIAQAHTTFSSAAFGTVLFTDSGIEGQGGD